MKARTKLFVRIAAATSSALLFASVIAGVSYADNNIKLTSAASATTSVVSEETASWSGYVAEQHVFNTVQAEIKVPTVTCTTKNSNLLIWVGFDGYNESHGTTEQVGVGADCGAVGSKPTYYTWYEMYPTNDLTTISKTIVDIKAGDSIWATVTYNGAPNYSYTMRVRNVRTNQAKNITMKCGKGQSCKRGSAEFIAERKYNKQTATFAALAKWSSDPTMFTNAKAAYGASRTLKPLSSYNPVPNDMYTNHFLTGLSGIASNGTQFTSSYKYSK